VQDGCYECHGLEAQGGSAGPPLSTRSLTLQALMKYVRQPGGQMPPYTSKVLPERDLAEIYAFLRALPEPSISSISVLSK
jgi:ubiquinol-cytochrome c reductase cytochrome c subunit